MSDKIGAITAFLRERPGNVVTFSSFVDSGYRGLSCTLESGNEKQTWSTCDDAYLDAIGGLTALAWTALVTRDLAP